jgi:plasmanylethanolamine desaturase
MLLDIILCFALGDLIVGLVHWVEDTYGLPSWPLIGKSVIIPNIDHHRNPGFIGSMSTILSRNFQPFLGALVAVGLCFLMDLVSWQIFMVICVAAMGNEVHTWNHSKTKNPVIMFLWDVGIIQSKKQHALHHIPPYDKYFCTVGNFMNAILEVLNFWRILEWIIALFGVKPKRLSDERDGF